MVLWMNGHVKPLNLECSIGLGGVPRWKGFGRAKHLFEPLKVVEPCCHHWLMKVLVAAGLQVYCLSLAFFCLAFTGGSAEELGESSHQSCNHAQLVPGLLH